MPIDQKRAEEMLKDPTCPFTREQFEACKLDNSKPLFEWSGIDIYLIINVKAKNAKH
jgi:hypothetical protein